MGFLPNDSESYLTVDTILTKEGRQLLAKGNNSFRVVKFTFGDDGIDYRLFNQSTGSVAQDSNILNTVITEAITDEDLAVHYPSISIADPTLKFLPNLSCNVSSLTLNEMTDASVGKVLEFSQTTVLTGKRVPAEIVDGAFILDMDNDLIAIDKQYPTTIYPGGRAHYVLPRTDINSVGGGKIAVNVIVQSLESDWWQRYGVGTVGSRTISTKLDCVGITSGLTKSIVITINEAISRTA